MFTPVFNNGYAGFPDGGSYMKVTIAPSGSYLGGDYLAWCSDAAAGIQIFGIYSATIIDSQFTSCPGAEHGSCVPGTIYMPDPLFTPDACVWNRINYLINHKNGANADSVQAALWDLISPPDAHALATTPNWNAGERSALVADAQANGGGFIPGSGELRAAVLYVDDDIQNVFIEVQSPQRCRCEITSVAVPSGGDLHCNPESLPTDDSLKTNVTVTGNCTQPAIDVSHQDSGTPCSMVRTFTIIVSDECGNPFATNTVVYTWKEDLIKPVAPAPPGDVNGQCDSDVPGKVNLTATDNCDGSITVAPTDARVTDGCGYTITRTWTFTDRCGNSSSVSQKIHIKDTLNPIAPSAPANVNGQCDSDVPGKVNLTATDNCSGAITVAPVDSAKVPDATGCGYTITRTWTFTDRCGNSSSVSQKIHIQDTTAPVLTVPADVSVSCGNVPPRGNYGVSDNCDANPTVQFSEYKVTISSSSYKIVRVWTATDACGNHSSKMQIITVTGCCQYTTYTPGGWGAPPNGNNVASLLKAKFSSVYPSGLTVGGTYTIKLTSALAVQNFLPSGGTPAVLKHNYTNPLSTEAGEFASQVIALKCNVDFSNAGYIKPGLPSLTIAAGHKLAGYTVTQVLTLANKVLGGNTSALPVGCTLSDLMTVMDSINNDFDNGTQNQGFLNCP